MSSDRKGSQHCRANRRISLLRGDSVRLRPIRWVWKDWLAAGKFHILAGHPGTGKTTLALSFAATISKGGLWPDGTVADPSNVVIWSGEDDPTDTLAPRLHGMDAAMARVHFVGNVDEGGAQRSFDPARDIAQLQQQTVPIGGVRLLIVDPVVSAVDSDSHKNAETRRSLQPLVDLAAALDCAVLGIHHLSKGTAGREPIERVTGSLAFGALARVVLIAAKLPVAGDSSASRILAIAKSNVGTDVGGFGYDLEQVQIQLPNHEICASRVVWRDAIEGNARELLAAAEPVLPTDPHKEFEQSLTEQAMEFLSVVLEDGQVLSKDVKRLAAEEGISQKPLRSARELLKVQVHREGFGANMKSYWSLPEIPFVPPVPVSAQLDEMAQTDSDGTSDGVTADVESM